jgi:hypothetical protein
MHHQDLLLGSEVILSPLISLNFEKLVFQESQQAPFHLARMPHLDQHSRQIYNITHETYNMDLQCTYFYSHILGNMS